MSRLGGNSQGDNPNSFNARIIKWGTEVSPSDLPDDELNRTASYKEVVGGSDKEPFEEGAAALGFSSEEHGALRNCLFNIFHSQYVRRIDYEFWSQRVFKGIKYTLNQDYNLCVTKEGLSCIANREEIENFLVSFYNAVQRELKEILCQDLSFNETNQDVVKNAINIIKNIMNVVGQDDREDFIKGLLINREGREIYNKSVPRLFFKYSLLNEELIDTLLEGGFDVQDFIAEGRRTLLLVENSGVRNFIENILTKKIPNVTQKDPAPSSISAPAAAEFTDPPRGRRILYI
ncbi:MAG TPA: hypothetical protein VI861_04300 [Rickettsiales bacterium]|nr:hypothetical protein [Rickettsiales bacterium]